MMRTQPVDAGAELLLADYAGSAGAWDDLLDGEPGAPRVRETWQSLYAALGQLGGAELETRRGEARRLFRENGVSYSSAADFAAGVRPWQLDPVPMLYSAEDWARIEAGLAQRARLFDAILKDLYGPRHLIRGGMVPPELIFGHPGFLRAVDGTIPREGIQLTSYAADLVRAGDGSFQVLADRLQAPAGAGLALETRMASARILPDLIRRSGVVRLARFFGELRDDLARRAPNQRLEPRIVVLGEGAEDPSYFDHAYLSGYLGYPLVEGADLTVREGHLWLRTIEGLKLVDIVLRRIADHEGDSLELHPTGRQGVPGLLEVARRGDVVIANPLGSGILESPALTPYLPRIARQFLGEDLKLESVQSWWCGDAGARQHVLENLSSLVIKAMDRSRPPLWGGGLGESELAALADEIRARPDEFVAQESGGAATTPALVDGVLAPRCAVTRCFLAAQGEGFNVMPGGFTRLLDPEDGVAGGLSTALGGTCKDTWVIAPEAERPLIRWPGARTEPLRHEWESLPSRAAEALHWVGRYAERGEYVTRLARTCLRRYNESRFYGDAADEASLKLLLRALGKLSNQAPDDAIPVDDSDFIEQMLIETVRDAALEGSLASCFDALQTTAMSVRERWSTDTWRVIDDIAECMEAPRSALPRGLGEVETTLDRLVSALVAFTGLTLESMTHEHGWSYLMIGRRLERARNLVRLLRSTLADPAVEGLEIQLLESLLVANESVMTHRRRFRAAPDVSSALQVLVLDPANPRSLAYQVLDLEKHLEQLPGAGRAGTLSADQRALLDASTRIRLANVEQLARSEPDGTAGRVALAALLDAVDAQLEDVSEELDRAYFTHVQPARQLQAASITVGIADDAEAGGD